jgi:hypothetical protein
LLDEFSDAISAVSLFEFACWRALAAGMSATLRLMKLGLIEPAPDVKAAFG